MKRHPALQPLSRDHNRGLAEARRLRRASGSADPVVRLEAARAFCDFFAQETAQHFREEEEDVFPLLVGEGEAPPPLVQALVEHARLRALTRRLEDGVAVGAVDSESLREAGDLLHDHIRLEERRLFPLIEQVVPEDRLAVLDLPDRSGRCAAEPSP